MKIRSQPSDETVAAWAQLMRAQRLSLSLVERKLKEAGLPPLDWYDLLLELERAGPLRPRDLQARLLLAQSNLSRLLDRMEDARLVARESCREDGRGLFVRITLSGKVARKKIWPVYAAGIQEAVGDKLSPAQAEKLTKLLKPLSKAD